MATLSITGAVGAPTRSGQKAANNAADVRKVQEALKTVRSAPNLKVSGTCDDATITAIKDFQKTCRTASPDGRVDARNSTVIENLNAILNPELHPIEQLKIQSGGYRIRLKGKLPPKSYDLFLGVSSTKKMQVHSLNSRDDLIDSKNLPGFLDLIDKAASWGKSGNCTLYTSRDKHIIGTSTAKNFLCPVKPYSGTLGPGEIGKGATDMIYSGLKDGRWFYVPAIDGKYYFQNATHFFETSNSKRGLNCITFVGGVYGVPVNSGAMGSYGSQLAKHLGASKIDMEEKKKADIIEYFKTNTTGTYILFNEGHVVLIENAVVHEFNKKGSVDGYHSVKVDDYEFATTGKKATYWLRKVAAAYGSFAPS